MAAILLLGVIGAITGVGQTPPTAKAQSTPAAVNCSLQTNAYWNEEAVSRLYANYPFYITSSIRKGADWKVLATFHMLEHSLVLDNPANGQGFMQLYSYVQANPDAFPPKADLSAEEVVSQLDLSYDTIQGKADGKLTANPDLEVLYQAAAAYNGLGHARKWPDHPYVVNDPPNGVFMKKPSRDGGPVDTVSKQAGFKPLYESLSAQCPTGATLLDPRLDSNREAIERCPTLGDPANVFPLQADAASIASGSDKSGNWLVWTPGAKNQHHDYDATDIHAPTGTPVVAMNSGKVVDVRAGEWRSGDWQPARLRVQSGDGCVLWYTHLLNGSVVVNEGDDVAAGQLLGQVGTPQDAMDTAPHLHIDVTSSLDDSQAARSRKACARDRARCEALTFDIQPVVAKLFLTQKVGGAATPVDASQLPVPIMVDQDQIPELESLLSLPAHSRYLVLAGLIVAFVLAVSTQFAPRAKKGMLADLASRAGRGDRKSIMASDSLRGGKVIYRNIGGEIDHEVVAHPIGSSARQSVPLLASWERLYSALHFFLMGMAPGLIGLGLATHPHWKFRGLPLGAILPWQTIGMERALTEIPFWFVLPVLLIVTFGLVYGLFALIALLNVAFALATKGGIWSSVRAFWSPRNQWSVIVKMKRFLPTLGLIQLELMMLYLIMGVSKSSVWRIGWALLLITAPAIFHYHRQIFRIVGWLIALPVLVSFAIILKIMLRHQARMATARFTQHYSRLDWLQRWAMRRIWHYPPESDSTGETDNRRNDLERDWQTPVR